MKYNMKKDIFVIGDAMVEAINSYKIGFNRNIADDINYRTFETCGCGTFLLTNYTKGLEQLFDIGKEIITYNSITDLDSKVKYYLEHEEERKIIAKAGFKRVRKDHTYDERTKLIMSLIEKI